MASKFESVVLQAQQFQVPAMVDKKSKEGFRVVHAESVGNVMYVFMEKELDEYAEESPLWSAQELKIEHLQSKVSRLEAIIGILVEMVSFEHKDGARDLLVYQLRKITE